MDAEIKTIITIKHEPRIVTLFGYASNGLPGLEIVGLGTFGQNLKEKMVYLTRHRQLPVPLKRFVLCLDGGVTIRQCDWKDLSEIELPALMLYWYLAGFLPLRSISGVLAIGKVLTSGKIIEGQFPLEMAKPYVLLSSNCYEGLRTMEPQEIMANVPEISFAKGPPN